jgi:hypothetical protein
VQETDTTSGLHSPSLENSSQPQPTPNPTTPASPSYVYALGRIEPRFPSLAVEKEFAQATGRADAAGLTDREALQSVLPDPPALLGVRDRGAGDLPAGAP